MQIDQPTLNLYAKDAPDLLQAVESDTAGDLMIMRKDPQTGFCMKFDHGLCGIHKQYGEKFLGEACSLYPRVTRALGSSDVIMTATMSCPEIARIVLAGGDVFDIEVAEVARLPQSLKDYLPVELPADKALALHQKFLAAVDDKTVPVERVFARISSATRALDNIDTKDWLEGGDTYLQFADSLLPLVEISPFDPFNMVHMLAGLIVASKKPISPRLKQTVADMEQALQIRLQWETLQMDVDVQSIAAYQRVLALWTSGLAAEYDEVLRRILKMQLSLSLHPFAGLGHTIPERLTLMGVRLAMFKLAIMCACAIQEGKVSDDVLVRVVQSLSRFVDHLGDAAFSLQICEETGWVKEWRLRGLLEHTIS